MKKITVSAFMPYLNAKTRKALEAVSDFTPLQAEKEINKNYNATADSFLNLVKDTVKSYGEETLRRNMTLRNQSDVVDYLNQIVSDADAETTFCIFLDAKNKVLAAEELNKGTITQSLMYPREIIKLALKYGAVCVIVAHNHPSQDVNPSQSDIQSTKRLYFALKELDMQLIDHLILSGLPYKENNYFSFQKSGLLSSMQAAFKVMMDTI